MGHGDQHTTWRKVIEIATSGLVRVAYFRFRGLGSDVLLIVGNKVSCLDTAVTGVFELTSSKDEITVQRSHGFYLPLEG